MIEQIETGQYFIEGLSLSTYGAVLFASSGGNYFTNVPASVIHHSPTGFSWGYEGSGPADLALNILEFAVKYLNAEGDGWPVSVHSGKCSAKAWRYHQEFKRQYIAAVPEIGGVIPWIEIKNWLVASMDNNPVPAVSPRTFTLAYPKEILDGFIMSHPNADVRLSRSAFVAHIEETILEIDPDVELLSAPYAMHYYEPTFITNDSHPNEEPSEMVLAARDKILDLFDNLDQWLITKGSIHEQG